MEELASIIDKPLTSAEVQRALSRFNLIEQVFDPLEEGMPAERFLTDKVGGLQIEIRPDGRIGTVFLHSFGKDGFGQFHYPLIGGLTFSSMPADVLECLGSPSAGAVLDPPSFGVTSWAKYETPLHTIHFSFGINSITLVTIMPVDWQPGGYSGG
ncbi:hypothetical protein [Xanthomonas campestris]|uniref:hypothetical protein n=1 Tax=Xanthomonas campestris TaxID=339 RepID=UPI00096D7CA6|nr:hypothetical protein [Xanthomonas campestris]MEA9839828.1 hypothetical protein [Xanthomonas campestris pv. raphani]MEA9878359.1 hypothetical protein [Xanthomonas campestris pv. raphani]MEA9894820.1 hypothetical protein [Xanthomonas campestris pv. raphani]QLC68367.1 hypothetical protein AD14011_01780 [Xanthomonas campestris pv. raphani]WDJ17884.1 hypothetical protein JH264_19275 [Xanthomonas campestris pv. raphani]